MKKGIAFLCTIILLFSIILTIISANSKEKVSSEKITVVATLFPQYDFVKQIGGEKVEVSLLLTPGTETHTYEPTPQDLIKINNSDLFIYTGKYMEPWSDKIASSIDADTQILDASKNIELIKSEDHDEEEHEEHHEHHEHEYDPHIWLNPQNAILMVRNICDELCKIDSKNTEFYCQNANKYIKEIQNLDEEFQNTVDSSKNKKIAFGGTFAYAYFIERYNLEYVTAYDSCGEDTEPSVYNVKKVIDYINENKIPVIFYQELSSGKIADAISSETNTKKLVMHTVHNVSQEDLNNNETYISIMKKNLENLKRALNY